ncbi:MAG: endonuclease [Planctomycetaceae bacterium]|nr:endonuclease [Planctomycetaceae bacterium]
MSTVITQTSPLSNLIGRIVNFFLKLCEPKPQQRPELYDVQPLKLPRWTSRNRRRQLLVEADPHCTYCGCKVNYDNSNLDHVLPKSRGGVHGWPPSNIVLTCKQCNTDKDSLLLSEWRDVIQKRVAAMQAINERDAVHELLLRKEYLLRILPRLEHMIETGIYIHSSTQDINPPAIEISNPSYSRRKPDEKVKRHHFGNASRRYAIVSRATGQLVLMDASLAEAADYLKTHGVDVALRLLGYQEMFNPAFNVPDRRIHARHRSPDSACNATGPTSGETFTAHEVTPTGEQARAA